METIAIADHAIDPIMSHVFIIPNFCEPEALLEETLVVLSSHSLAARYTVVLAMEDSEEGHDEKAQQLTKQFSKMFHRIFYTSHILNKEIEDPGKASNENWAARHVSKEVELYPERYASAVCTHIDRKDLESADHESHKCQCCQHCCGSFTSSNVMLHILDADAHVHDGYMLELESACRRKLQEDDATSAVTKAIKKPLPGSITRSVFGAPIIMSRNILEVAWLSRVQDTLWGAVAFQNISAYSKIGNPMSNYSMSLKLVEDIDFFDTTNESIAEDIHFFLKAFFKTNGTCQLEPIYVPHNMLNLNTNDGWFATVYARYIQAERHAKAVSELAYVLRQIMKHPWGYKKYIALWQTFIVTLFPPCVPVFTSLAGPFCQLLHWIHGWFDDPTLYFLLMWVQTFALTTIVIVGVEVYCHDAATRAANKHLYQRPNMSMKDTLLPLPLSIVCLFVYCVIPYGVASVKSILPNRFANNTGFVVAKKVQTK